MDIITLKYLLLFFVGIVAGAVNIVAGGGSFLTVPILMMLGLPATVANGTNRVAVFLQSVYGVKKFKSYGIFPAKFSLIISIPAVAGSIFGAYLATIMSNEDFKGYFAFFMIAITLVTIFYKPKENTDTGNTKIMFWQYPAFFLIGIYGGFIQAGVGFLILAGSLASGYKILQGNAVKAFIILIFTAFALPVFFLNGKIEIVPALVLSAGNLIGVHIGTTLSVKMSNNALKNVVTLVVIIFAIKLILF